MDKLARGDRVYGVSTYDLSLENARSLARADIDYVYVDMEHGPMDFRALHAFLLGMIDKQAIAEAGSLRQRVSPLARIAPYGRESSEWAVKQALDIGLMGLIFPSIETPEQALGAVRSMRYPPRRGSRYPEPPGLRGSGPAIATWFWGLSPAEYTRRADLWPLNPVGDLVALMMIETAAGVRNVDAIAAVPGVTGLLIGPSDLSNSLGVARRRARGRGGHRDDSRGVPYALRGVRHHGDRGRHAAPRRAGVHDAGRRPRGRRAQRRERRRGARRPGRARLAGA